MTDADSLVVGYDARRGEPRGKVTETARGDCVDCRRCVAVCPTGIDIRRGLQLDCIGCTACIDACNAIMDKLYRPRGLIRYDSLRGLEGEQRRLWRPRFAIYAALGSAGLLAALLALRHHSEFEANLLRLPGAPYTLDDGEVRNAFALHLVNKRGTRATLRVEPMPPPDVQVVAPLGTVTLEPLESAEAPIFFRVVRAKFHSEFTVPIRVRVQEDPGATDVVVVAPFLGPAPGGP